MVVRFIRDVPGMPYQGVRRGPAAREQVLRHRGRERLIDIAGERSMQLPGDSHRLLPDVPSVGGRTEEPEGAVVGT